MKLLASYNLTGDNSSEKVSPVELWRIKRPIEALKKHTNWQIEETSGIFKKQKKNSEVTDEEMNERVQYFKNYDFVWDSYHTNPFVHIFTMLAQERIPTKFVMDIDDNIFDIDPLNPIKAIVEEHKLEILKGIAVDALYLTTTTETLAEILRKQRYYRDPKSVVVIPNMISTEVYKPGNFDNGDKIVIGYAGGASHYADLHYTGLYDALKDIMHKYKNVYVKSVGMFFDKYLPKARYQYLEGSKGAKGWYKVYSELNFDIAIAPLEDTAFTRCKSNIKWQEYSLMGAPGIYSNVGPYKDTIKHGKDGWLVDNNYDAWYNALETLISNISLRKKIGQKAKDTVIKEHSLENNWNKIKDGFEKF